MYTFEHVIYRTAFMADEAVSNEWAIIWNFEDFTLTVNANHFLAHEFSAIDHGSFTIQKYFRSF